LMIFRSHQLKNFDQLDNDLYQLKMISPYFGNSFKYFKIIDDEYV